MNGRHVLLLIAAAAVALCAVFVLRMLDGGEVDTDAEPAEAAPPPTPTIVRAESGREAAAPRQTPAPPGRPVEPSPQPAALTGLEDAQADLDHLAALLRSGKAINEELISYLDVVLNHYLHPPPPAGFVLHADPDAGAGQVRRVVNEANLRLLAEEQRWPYDYVEEILAWRRKAEKLFLKALGLQRIDRERDGNIREDVNIKAAQALAATENPELSPDIIRTVEKRILKARHTVGQALLDESLGALAQLGHAKSLPWMRKEFTHTKSSPQANLDQLAAAHAAMLRFDLDKVPGSERRELVYEMIKTYSGVEQLAAQRGSSDQTLAAQALWERVGKNAVRVVQRFASDPQSDDEEPLATMAELQDWFRRHKNPRKPPWDGE